MPPARLAKHLILDELVVDALRTIIELVSVRTRGGISRSPAIRVTFFAASPITSAVLTLARVCDLSGEEALLTSKVVLALPALEFLVACLALRLCLELVLGSVEFGGDVCWWIVVLLVGHAAILPAGASERMGTEVTRLPVSHLEGGHGTWREATAGIRWVRTFPRPDEALAF
jgi:hypothetical protein